MATQIIFTAEQQKVLRVLIENNLLEAVMNEATDGDVDMEMLDDQDESGEATAVIFEQNNMTVAITGELSLF